MSSSTSAATNSTSSTFAAATSPYEKFSIHESLSTEIPAIKTVIADWLETAEQRHFTEHKLAEKAKERGKLTDSESKYVLTLNSSRKTLLAMLDYLNQRVGIETPHCSMRVITSSYSTHTHAIAIFETIGNELMFIAANPNTLCRVTDHEPEGKRAATSIILHLAVEAFKSDRSITVHTSPFAQPYFRHLGFEPYLSNQDYIDLQASIKKYYGLRQEAVLKPRSDIKHPILLLPQDCYLMLSPEPEKE